MSETKFTSGPLTVRMSDSWPWGIKTIDAAGEIVFFRGLPCHASSDKTAAQALACVHFDGKDRKAAASRNAQALADEYVRAAAPELYEVLERLVRADEGGALTDRLFDEARGILKKARGEPSNASGSGE